MIYHVVVVGTPVTDAVLVPCVAKNSIAAAVPDVCLCEHWQKHASQPRNKCHASVHCITCLSEATAVHALRTASSGVNAPLRAAPGTSVSTPTMTDPI